MNEKESGVSEERESSQWSVLELEGALREAAERWVVDGAGDELAAERALERMDALALEIKAYRALSRAERFFKEREPSERFNLRWGGFGSEYVVVDSQGDLEDRSCRELEGALNPWVWGVVGSAKMEGLSKEDALARLGESMLGKEGFGRWRSKLERSRLSAAAKPAGRSAGGPSL